jgi:hypothetical protein
MPRISVDEFPTTTRSGRVSKYAEEMAELEELLAEDDFGAGQGCMFDIDKDDLSALVSSLRKVGKTAGRKVKTVFADGSVYVTDGGPIPETEATEETPESESSKTIRQAVAARGKK